MTSRLKLLWSFGFWDLTFTPDPRFGTPYTCAGIHFVQGINRIEGLIVVITLGQGPGYLDIRFLDKPVAFSAADVPAADSIQSEVCSGSATLKENFQSQQAKGCGIIRYKCGYAMLLGPIKTPTDIGAISPGGQEVAAAAVMSAGVKNSSLRYQDRLRVNIFLILRFQHLCKLLQFFRIFNTIKFGNLRIHPLFISGRVFHPKYVQF